MAQKWVQFPFGIAGDRAVIPQDTDLSGNVSYEQGYGPDYQRPKTDPLSKNIERDKMNGLFYDITANLQHYQLNGVPDWVDPALNDGIAVQYPRFARVRYAVDGNIYVSSVNGNVSVPGANTDWLVESGRLLAVVAFGAIGLNNYIPNAQMAKCLAYLWGGAGGSSGVPATGVGTVSVAGGGGGGSFAIGEYTRAQIGASQPLTIGNGGNAGAVGINNGTDGGATSLGALLSVPGGLGSIAKAAAAAPMTVPGASGGGDPSGVNILYRSRGNPGGAGVVLTPAVAGTSYGGSGGPNGMGGGAQAGNTNGPGIAGNTVGAGGSGGCQPVASAAGYSGAGGSSGYAIIFEYA